MRALVVTVPGRVAAQGSKNHRPGGGFYEASKYLKPWRDSVVLRTKLALGDGWDPNADGFAVEVAFAFERPKSHYVAGDRDRPLKVGVPLYCRRAPDVDKCSRAILDALTIAGAIGDDALVVQLRATKLYASRHRPPGAVVVVTPVAVDGRHRP